MQTKSAFQFYLHGFFLLCAVTACAQPIDRHALVTRHDVVLTNFDAANPLSVGNGEFAFTVDATGLQTFPEAFDAHDAARHAVGLGLAHDSEHQRLEH